MFDSSWNKDSEPSHQDAEGAGADATDACPGKAGEESGEETRSSSGDQPGGTSSSLPEDIISHTSDSQVGVVTKLWVWS